MDALASEIAKKYIERRKWSQDPEKRGRCGVPTESIQELPSNTGRLGQQGRSILPKHVPMSNS
jgi:hypothetical protein